MSAALEISAPDPGGREGAIVTLPAPGVRFVGVHEETFWNRQGMDTGRTPDNIARIAKAAGIEVMRFGMTWHELEPSQDRWNESGWARYELAYDALIKRGIRPLIGLMVAPPWARDIGFPTLCPGVRPCEYPPRPAMLGEWAEFTAEVARRFPKALAIEIWNEPNLSLFWKPEPQPERYAAMVAAAYDAINAVSPKIKVLGGAVAPGLRSERTINNGAMNMRDFLVRAYQANPGLAGHMDGLSFHQSNQFQRFGKNSHFAQAFAIAREVTRRYDRKGLPLWITEFSISTSGPRAVTAAEQGAALLRATRRVITMRDVRGIVLHMFRDREELPETHGEHGIGLLASYDPFVPKPAYCELAGRVRGKRPPAPCRRIRDSHVSRCTRSLVRLRNELSVAYGDERAALNRRYRRTTGRCAPRTYRNEACKRKLAGLQRLYGRVVITLRLDVLNRHERALTRCS